MTQVDESTTVKMSGGQSAFIFLSMIPLMILRGWILAVMAGWFLVPLGVPRFGTWVGAGLLVTAALVKGRDDSDPKDFQRNVQSAITGATHALLALGFGFIWHLAAG